jgi:hypothetical protein
MRLNASLLCDFGFAALFILILGQWCAIEHDLHPGCRNAKGSTGG